MREEPRPRNIAGDTGSAPPQLRPGRALAHNTGASGSGTLRRSDGRTSHTPRGGRHTGRHDRFGTSPPVPERSFFFPRRAPRTPRDRRVPRLPLFAAPCALLLALVTWQVVTGGPLRDLGERLGRSTGRPGTLPDPGYRDPVGGLAEFFADLGHVYVALPVAAAAAGCAGWLAVRHAAPGPRWRPPLLTACALAAVPLLVVPLKEWTDRAGPVGGDGYYPSGHTVTAAVAHGAAVLLLLPYVRRTAPRRLLVAGFLLVNLGVGAGLVRRGYHWPLDVLGGWLLSALLLCALGAALAGRQAPRGRTETEPKPVSAGTDTDADPGTNADLSTGTDPGTGTGTGTGTIVDPDPDPDPDAAPGADARNGAPWSGSG